MGADLLTVSVVVPTFRRTAHLQRCLSALAEQRRRPEQVVVVVRDTDEATRAYLAAGTPPGLSVEVVGVGVPGMVAALNAGLCAARGDIVAFTDDDAAPWPDWIERLRQHFESEPHLGGVGGRDWIPGFERAKPRRDVGRLQ